MFAQGPKQDDFLVPVQNKLQIGVELLSVF